MFAIDAKNYRGRLRLSPDGLLWHGRTFLLPTLSATRWEADMLQDRIGAPDVAVVPIVAVLGAVVPYGQVTSMGVTVVPVRRLVGLLRSLPPTLTPERAREVAAQMNRRLDAYRPLRRKASAVPSRRRRPHVGATCWVHGSRLPTPGLLLKFPPGLPLWPLGDGWPSVLQVLIALPSSAVVPVVWPFVYLAPGLRNRLSSPGYSGRVGCRGGEMQDAG